jgi:gluconolactonase
MNDALSTILESPTVERLASGFGFTEGPLWHPDGFLYFVDIRRSQLLRWQPARGVEVVRENTGEGNGLTFDRQGRLIMCEGGHRRVSRTAADGTVAPLAERWQGKRLNRPNDVVCRSDGSLYFTDPGMRVPPEERELERSSIFRVAPDGTLSIATADCEYPNGLAFSPDERTLYVANTRTRMFIHAFDVQPDGSLINHRSFWCAPSSSRWTRPPASHILWPW